MTSKSDESKMARFARELKQTKTRKCYECGSPVCEDETLCDTCFDNLPKEVK